MKLIKQTLLSFKKGTSDKVYEVDLCEVGDNEYVVNFRYGRRGNALKDGTKTVLPVSLEKAEALFEKLVSDKVKKGYLSSSTGQKDQPEEVKQDRNGKYTRTENLLFNLEQLVKNPDDKKLGKKLDRAIWRAGDLKVKEAIPFLLDLLSSEDTLRNYCIIRSLGQCADAGDPLIIDKLKEIYAGQSISSKTGRVCLESLLLLADDSEKTALTAPIEKDLPGEIHTNLHDAQALVSAVYAYLSDGDYKKFDILYKLYLINTKEVRTALLEIITQAPFMNNYFKQVRHIFKAAEIRFDKEFLALIFYKIEKEKFMYAADTYTYWVYAERGNNSSIRKSDLDKELKKETSKWAYGKSTKKYFRRRCWRFLRELGEQKKPEYVQFAIQYLLHYSDKDGRAPGRYTKWSYSNGWHEVSIYFDRFTDSWILNQILHKNSDRYVNNGNRWVFKDGFKTGDEAVTKREEAFPELWDEQFDEIIPLLKESRCKPVHTFGVQVLRENKDFMADPGKEAVIVLLSAPYASSAALGLELAKRIIDLKNLDTQLVLFLLNCTYQNARAYAFDLIDKNKDLFTNNDTFLIDIATSSFKDTRNFAFTLYESLYFDEERAKIITTRLLAHILSLTDDTYAALDLNKLILASFSNYCKELGIDVINDLLAHPLQPVQSLGAEILTIHRKYSTNPPQEILTRLIESQVPEIKALGVRLFAGLDIQILEESEDTLLAFLTNANESIRNEARPVLQKIIKANPGWIEKFFPLLITKLKKSRNEDVQSFIYIIIKEDFTELSHVPNAEIFKLIKAKSTVIQELGTYLLQRSPGKEHLTIDEVILLANNDVLAGRQIGWDFCQTNQHVLKDNIDKVIRLLDAKWEDSRLFMSGLIRSDFVHTDFTPASLVSICDSVRPEISAFGREMVTRFFEKEHGHEYLVKLSEHPSVSMQLFVTNYLSEYAAGNLERLCCLKHYFKSVLCRVNKARAAKTRIITFLKDEIAKSKEAAALIAEIIAFVSATVAIGDKARFIELLLSIKTSYPGIDVPVITHEIEVKNAI